MWPAVAIWDGAGAGFPPLPPDGSMGLRQTGGQVDMGGDR